MSCRSQAGSTNLHSSNLHSCLGDYAVSQSIKGTLISCCILSFASAWQDCAMKPVSDSARTKAAQKNKGYFNSSLLTMTQFMPPPVMTEGAELKQDVGTRAAALGTAQMRLCVHFLRDWVSSRNTCWNCCHVNYTAVPNFLSSKTVPAVGACSFWRLFQGKLVPGGKKGKLRHPVHDKTLTELGDTSNSWGENYSKAAIAKHCCSWCKNKRYWRSLYFL